MALIVGGSDLRSGRYLTVVDALRGEAYVGLFEVDAGNGVTELAPARLVPTLDIDEIAREHGAEIVSPSRELATVVAFPKARAVARLENWNAQRGPVDLATWEPSYGRLSEAQVRWETAHGKPLPMG
jgi:tRNA A37 threonylcarbamoyladenosine modification protein TsaB